MTTAELTQAIDNASGLSTEDQGSALKRSYVLDTNVLLHDPHAIFKFKEHDVVIPITVIEEVDRFKKELSELGRNARQISRFLDQLRSRGSLATGVPLEGGGRLFVDLVEDVKKIPGLDPHANDSLILGVALALHRQQPERPVVFISKDTNMRLRADAFGLLTEDYDDVRLPIEELYTGSREVGVPGNQLDQLFALGELELALDGDASPLCPNEFVMLRNLERPNVTALSRFSAQKRRLIPVRRPREGFSGLLPRNKEQAFAIDLLMDDDVKLVTLVGKAGTGKTLLAIAVGLHKVTEEDRFSRLLVSRPIFPLGRDVGYLPGDLGDKLSPWMKPIFDNVEYLLDLKKESTTGKKGPTRGYEELITKGMLEIEPLTYIRGRSIPNQYLIIDEAQNLTPHEIKTILTRAGEGTRVILTGDPYQIDNPYVDATNNGLTYVVERFKGESIAGHVTLIKGERSELAELAANLL